MPEGVLFESETRQDRTEIAAHLRDVATKLEADGDDQSVADSGPPSTDGTGRVVDTAVARGVGSWVPRTNGGTPRKHPRRAARIGPR